jgi:hypothetical protein
MRSAALPVGAVKLDVFGIFPSLDEEGEDSGERVGFPSARAAGDDGEVAVQGEFCRLALWAFLGKVARVYRRGG